MRTPLSFVAGLVAGAVLALAVAAHADWNGPPGASPDRQLLERIARANEDSARHLADMARAEADVARGVSDLARRCR